MSSRGRPMVKNSTVSFPRKRESPLAIPPRPPCAAPHSVSSPRKRGPSRSLSAPGRSRWVPASAGMTPGGRRSGGRRRQSPRTSRAIRFAPSHTRSAMKVIPTPKTSPILPPSHAQGRMRSERSAWDSRGGGVATAVGLGYAAPGPRVLLLRRGMADQPGAQAPRRKARHPEAHAPLLFPEVYCASGPVLPCGGTNRRSQTDRHNAEAALRRVPLAAAASPAKLAGGGPMIQSLNTPV